MKIGIALAAYQPQLENFAEQLNSIVKQTHSNWVCHVQLDSPLAPLMDSAVLAPFFKDIRFSWADNSEVLGATKNFEKAANQVLNRHPDINYLAFSDQDDVWLPGKLERSLLEIQKRPALSLVHCDMSVKGGQSGWALEKRGVDNVSTLALCIRNVVAGAGLLMDADLWRQYPVIPEAIPYHDRWAALLASIHGGVYPIREKLYEYRLHDSNILGLTVYQGRFALATGNPGSKGLSRLQRASEIWRTLLYKWNELNSITLALPIAFQPQAVLVKDLGFSLMAYAFRFAFSDPALFRAALARSIGKAMSGNEGLIVERAPPVLPPVRSNTLACIVTYQPDTDVIENLEQHAKVFEKIVVLDNASEEDARTLVSKWCAKDPEHRLFIASEKNLGVAEGHNRSSHDGLKKFAERQWLAFFDQDTFVLENFFEVMSAAYQACPYRDRIGIIGSNYTDTQTGKTRSNWSVEGIHPPAYKIETVVITSGSLVPAPIWKTIGGYNNEWFIDHVDDEYCLRAREKGYHVIQPWTVTIQHRIGSVKKVKMGKKTLYPMNQPAYRWKFVTRNFIWLIKKFGSREIPWIIANSWGIWKRFWIMVLLESGRKQKIPAALRGIRDGIRNKPA